MAVLKFELLLTDYDVLSTGPDGGHHYASTQIEVNGEMRRIVVLMDDKADEIAIVEMRKIKVIGNLLDEPNQALILNDAIIVKE